MYTYAYDKTSALLVGVLKVKPHFNEDEDYAICVESIARYLNTGKPGDPFKYVMFVDPDVPVPSATWRRKFATLRGKAFFPFLLVVVTPSQLLRGVLTMINWVSPPQDGSATTSVASLEEAVVWLEQRTGKKVPLVRKLFDEAIKGSPLR